MHTPTHHAPTHHTHTPTHTHRFANNKIVRSYCLVLKEYRKNSEAVNHAVVKMLYRIAIQLKMAPLLYQISIFRTLQSIMEEPTSSRFKVHSVCTKYRIIIIIAGN